MNVYSWLLNWDTYRRSVSGATVCPTCLRKTFDGEMSRYCPLCYSWAVWSCFKKQPLLVKCQGDMDLKCVFLLMSKYILIFWQYGGKKTGHNILFHPFAHLSRQSSEPADCLVNRQHGRRLQTQEFEPTFGLLVWGQSLYSRHRALPPTLFTHISQKANKTYLIYGGGYKRKYFILT